MSDHRVSVGAAVDYFAGKRFDTVTGGRYTVARLLPLEGHTPQYRIKSGVDGRERVVRESEIGARADWISAAPGKRSR